MKIVELTPTDILKRPYRRVFLLNPDGGITALIEEFPGCIAEGDTPQEAWDSLNRTAESWLMAVMEAGKSIPEPKEKDWREW